MSYPKPLIYFRNRTANLPASLSPSDLNPANLGVQISSISTFQLSGTPSAEFALLGKGPRKSPSSAGTISTDNPWTLQGSEVRIYLDNRANSAANLSSAGEANCPLVFCGDLHEIRPSGNSATPWYAYSCAARGLTARAERVPVVSPIDNGDTIRFNINALLDDYQPSTGGKSIGQAIYMVLTTYAVAYRLNLQGIGNFTLDDTAQTATLPSVTESDLNSMTLVPPFEFRISGDNVIAAIQQTLDAYAPNFSLVIQPDGTIRFPDLRNNQPYNLDLISDVVDGLNYTKSTLGSYSRVIVRGGPKVVPYYCQWNIPRDNPAYNLDDSPDNSKFNGNMVEYFDYTGNTTTQAKVNYNHANFTWGRILLSIGNVSFSYANGTANLPSNQIRVTPSTSNLPNSNTTSLSNWLADELTMIDKGTESRREARVKVNRNFWKIGTGGSANSIIRKDSGEFLITNNTEANATVNWSILTTNPNVDRPPTYNATTNYFTYDYELYGYTRPGSTTWRRYKINLDAISSNNPLTTTQKGMARRIGNFFPQPVDGLNFSQIGNSNTSAGVNQQRKTWYPECLVEYRQRVGSNGTFLYQAFWAGFRIDPVTSQIVLTRPAVQDPGNNNGTYTDKMPPWDTGTGNSTNQPFQIVPYNLKVLLPVYEGTQEAVYPHYNANMTPVSGESNATVKTRYGMERDLIITLPEWYDQRDQASADQYAKDLWDSVEKPLIQGGFAWVDGVPESGQWSVYGILSNSKLQSFTVTSNETCNANAGSGIEDCPLLMTACEIKFPGDRKPFTVASFTTARPRVTAPMHDFHSFEEMLTRDPYMI